MQTERRKLPPAVFICSTIVINEIPVSLKLDDGLVISIGVTRNFIQDAFIFPRSCNATAHCIANLFWKSGSIREVIPVSTFMYPGSFRKTRKTNRNNRTVQFDHVLFQSGIVALGVSPIKIRLTVIVNKNCRINIIPPNFGIFGGHVIGDQCRTAGICKRTCRKNLRRPHR